MAKLYQLEKRLKNYQAKYRRLLKKGDVGSARYGDEYRDLQLRVLERAIRDAKEEILQLKKSKKKTKKPTRKKR